MAQWNRHDSDQHVIHNGTEYTISILAQDSELRLFATFIISRSLYLKPYKACRIWPIVKPRKQNLLPSCFLTPGVRLSTVYRKTSVKIGSNRMPIVMPSICLYEILWKSELILCVHKTARSSDYLSVSKRRTCEERTKSHNSTVYKGAYL